MLEKERRISGRDERRSEGFQRNDRKRNSGFDSAQTPRQRNDYNSYNNSQTERADRSGFDPPSKRRAIDPPKSAKSVFSRLSGPASRDDEEYVKPRLNSRVIKEQPTRQEIVAAQGSDAQSIARNRRMFAGLLGTLQKFCQEESRLKPREEKKAKIEKRLEEQEKQEREILKKEKQNLFVDKKRKQLEIKMIEIKMLKLKDFSAWEELQRPLLNFVRTRTRPHIYYMPKTLNKETQEKQKKCRAELEGKFWVN
jgi:pinin